MQRRPRSAGRICLFLVVVLVALNALGRNDAHCAGSAEIEGHPAEVELRSAVATGLLRGYPDGTLRPDLVVSRAEVAAILCRALGEESNSTVATRLLPPFGDVPSNHWASGYLRVCYEAGLVLGDGDGNVRPEEAVSRAEVAVVVARAARSLGFLVAPKESLCSDEEEIPEWAYEDVAYSLSLGLVQVDQDGRFRPWDGSTRAEVAAAVLRLMGLLGRMWDLIGTVSYLNPQTGVLRLNASGNEITLSTGPESAIYKGSSKVYVSNLAVGSEARVILDRNTSSRIAVIVVD